MENLAPFGFLLFFPLLWCGVCWIIAVVGGWSALAAQFRTYETPRGRRFGMQSARLGMANYGSCLTIHIDHDGMFLAVWPLFRVGHPPLFIPWSEFHEYREKKMLFWRFDEVAIGSSTGSRLQLRKGLLPDAIVNARPAHRSHLRISPASITPPK